MKKLMFTLSELIQYVLVTFSMVFGILFLLVGLS